MKQVIFSIGICLFSLAALASKISQANWQTEVNPRPTYGRNFVGVELLGRGVAYSLTYDRSVQPQIALGGGFTYYKLNFSTNGIDILLVPLYANYYFAGNYNHRGFFSAGATLIYVKAEISNTIINYETNTVWPYQSTAEGATLAPNIGLGYEYRTRGGFSTRLAAYGQYAFHSVVPWAGITLGTRF